MQVKNRRFPLWSARRPSFFAVQRRFSPQNLLNPLKKLVFRPKKTAAENSVITAETSETISGPLLALPDHGRPSARRPETRGSAHGRVQEQKANSVMRRVRRQTSGA